MKSRKAKKRELAKLLGDTKKTSQPKVRVDLNTLIKVTLHNNSHFWDRAIRITDSGYQFEKLGLVPREMIKHLFFWQKQRANK